MPPANVLVPVASGGGSMPPSGLHPARFADRHRPWHGSAVLSARKLRSQANCPGELRSPERGSRCPVRHPRARPGHQSRHGAGITGVRKVALPALRTGLAGLPHPALPSVVSPSRGLADRITGSLQAEQPEFGKESIRPAHMIGSVSLRDPLPSLLPSKDAPRPAANPAVNECETSFACCAGSTQTSHAGSG